MTSGFPPTLVATTGTLAAIAIVSYFFLWAIYGFRFAARPDGLQITPPDLNSTTDRIFIPRSALTEVTVLGVVGIARRKPAAAAVAVQPSLFNE